MARIMYKKVKRRRPRNTLQAQALKDGVLRPKVIGDKRHKFLENQAKKRELEYMRMNKEMRDD